MTKATEQEVKAAADKFYAAANQMFTGDLTLMKEIWSHADDVIYMGPGGAYRVGWPAVLADWEAQAALKLGGRIEPTEMRITLGDGLAITHSIEVGQNDNIDAHQEPVKIRATNVYRKEADGWKMISCHTDKLAYLQDI